MNSNKNATAANSSFKLGSEHGVWHFNKQYDKAVAKALANRPDVVSMSLTEPVYAVRRSEPSEWAIVILNEEGGPIGAKCNCPGGNHVTDYHIAAAVMYHSKKEEAFRAIDRMAVAAMIEADPTLMPSAPIFSPIRCERCKKAGVVEAKLCQDCLNEFWIGVYEQGVPVMKDQQQPSPAPATISLFITVTTAPATAGDPGPRCANPGCGAELSRSNRGSKGYCVKCWAEKLRKDETDLGF